MFQNKWSLFFIFVLLMLILSIRNNGKPAYRARDHKIKPTPGGCVPKLNSGCGQSLYKYFEAFDGPIRRKNFTNWPIKICFKAFAVSRWPYPLYKYIPLNSEYSLFLFNLVTNKDKIILELTELNFGTQPRGLNVRSDYEYRP